MRVDERGTDAQHVRERRVPWSFDEELTVRKTSF